MLRFLILTISLFFTLSGLGQKPSTAPDVLVVELPRAEYIRHAGIIAAQKEGLFSKAGLKVEVRLGVEEEQIKSNISNGLAHFSTTGPDIILDVSEGMPFVVFSAFFQRSSQLIAFHKKAKGNLSIEELTGNKVIINSRKSVEMIAMLNSGKKYTKNLDILYGDPNKEAKFWDYSVRGIETSVLSQFYKDIEVKSSIILLRPVFANVEMYDNCLYTNSSFLKENEEIVKKFNKACLDGWALYMEEPLSYAEMFNVDMQNQVSRRLYKQQIWHLKNTLMMPNLIKPGEMNKDKWERIESIYKKYGSLDSSFDGAYFSLLSDDSMVRTESPINWTYVSGVVGAIILILAFLSIVNMRLTRMVNKRTMEIAEVNWQLNKLNDELEDRIDERTYELQEALKKAEVANKAKSTFLANMTHEIRTPMNSILGFAQIMKEKSSDPHMKKYLDTISSSGHSLLRIINDVLDLSRVESGRFSLDYSRFNILRLIEETMATFSEELRGKKVKLHFDHSDECPEYVFLDKDRLRQILTNLIGNAVKFTEEGLIEVKLSVKMVGPKDADLTIEVKDTGIGIPEENLNTIFGEFEQVDDVHRHYGGTGLGLAIAKQFVEMMNGTLTVKSELDRGSDFKVVLNKVGIVDKADEMPSENKLQFFFEPAKVMVVDDCEVTLELFDAYLSVTRLTVKTFKNPFDALKALADYKPDLILTEITLREMDGFQFAEEVRQKKEFKKIPIIAVSPITHTGSRQKFRIFNGVLKKPVPVDEFYLSLSHFLPCKKVDKKIEVKGAHVEAKAGQSAEFDFRSLISKETREKCVDAMKFQVINDYQDIYSLLKSLAEDINCTPLKKWLEEFNANLAVFNFEALNRQLEYLMNSKDAST